MIKIKAKELGSYLKKCREMAGFTQKDVANEFGYTSPQFVSNWERGLISPPLETLSSLKDLYDLDGIEIRRILMDAAEESIREMGI